MTHRLAARTLICSLEEGGSMEGEGGDKEKVKEKVVKISTEARVISTHTAFIAVNKDLNQAVQGPLIQRNMRPQMMHYSTMKRMKMSSCAFGTPLDKEDPMLTLISLQKADGSWELNESLVSVFEKKEQEAISKMPAEVRSSSLSSLSLKGISVQLKVQGFVADVCSTLSYENSESSPVEAVFVFPMEEDSSVYDFHAEIGGVKIQAEIREKQEARDTYDDALSSGQQAFLLEESDESRDVFRLSVGSLPAGQKATVCLSYVTELAVEADGALRYCLPAILNPRYTPAGAQSLTTPVSGASGGPVPYSLSFSAHLTSPSGVAQVKSNCDLTPLEYLRDDKTQAQLFVFTDGEVGNTKDVINEVKKHAGTHRGQFEAVSGSREQSPWLQGGATDTL
ncbi:UNVERIFIED_CONTAM: hypothetical protein FKN15_042402 [Acipenser sinensis]